MNIEIDRNFLEEGLKNLESMKTFAVHRADGLRMEMTRAKEAFAKAVTELESLTTMIADFRRRLSELQEEQESA